MCITFNVLNTNLPEQGAEDLHRTLERLAGFQVLWLEPQSLNPQPSTLNPKP